MVTLTALSIGPLYVVHGLVFQSSGGSSYGQRKRQTHVMGDVLPTLARCLINDILSCMACASMMIFNLKQTKKKLPSILKLCEPSEFQECDAMAAMADGVACILCRVCLFHYATCRNGNDIFRHVFVFNIFGAAVEQHAECCWYWNRFQKECVSIFVRTDWKWCARRKWFG